MAQKPISHIIVTHGHSDHLGDTVELAEKTGAEVITSFELAEYLKHTEKLSSVTAMGIGGEIHRTGVKIKLFHARHGAGIGNLHTSFVSTPTGVLLHLGGKTIYHAGDTGLMYDMKLLAELYTIDVAFLPIGNRFTMGPNDAGIATGFIKPTVIVPIHYNTRPDITIDIQDFIQSVTKHSMSEVKVMKPGESFVLK